MRRFLLLSFLFLMISSSLWAQTGTVTGKVTGPDGSGIPGVSIVVKGTTNGVITDSDGMYSIQATEGILVFTFIGYKAVEVSIDNRTSVDVKMEEDLTALDEVVVVGYGTQRKKDITTAVVTVAGEELDNRPIVNITEGLQGKATGVQVTQNSGKPGNPVSIRIRGSTSIEAGNEPLYVVDGIQMEDIRGINPSDIATFSILKDAASAAIYGARAANGVVLITTKRGLISEPKVRFDTYVGVSNIRKTIDVLNTQQYEELMLETGVGAIPDNTTNTDWSDLVFGTGLVQNYNLGISGGNESMQYLLSGGYLKNEGMVEPAVFDRYSLRLNLDNKIKDWLKVGTNLNFIRIKTEDTPDNLSSGRGGVIMSTLNSPPFLKPYEDDGSGQFDNNPFQPSWENPYAYMYGTDQEVIENRLYGNVNLDARIIGDLSYKGNFGFDLGNTLSASYLDPFRTSAGRNVHGSGYANRYNYNSWIAENMLSYVTTLANNHNINLIIGSTVQKRRNDYSSVSGTNFPSNTNVRTVNAANDVTGFSDASDTRLTSLFGRLTYDYKGKYLFTSSVRRDGSSKLAKPYRTMPAFSAGWRISSESFMESVETVNDLKIRVGWGRTGNQNGLPAYAKNGLVGYTKVPQPPDPADFNGPATSQISFANPGLKWETTDQTNFGIDVALLDSRLAITFDAYIKKTSDLIFSVPLPQTLSLPTILTNAGAMENKGIEVDIKTVNLEKNELQWTTDFNISFNRNKVTDVQIIESVPLGIIYSNNQPAILIKKGYSLGTFYGYVSEGVDPDTGDIRYKDVNGNGVFDSDGDRTVIGNAQPDFIFGLTNNLSYKRWSLNIFFQGSVGNDVYNATRIDLEGMFDSKNQSTRVLDRWTPTNTNTDIPRAGNLANVRNSSRFVENGSYVRLKAITLSYDFNPEWINRVGINKLSLYATGQNLLTFTDYSGFDPEVNAFGQSAAELGIDYGTYPQQRTLIFGLNLEF